MWRFSALIYCAIFAERVFARSTGAGSCVSCSSYTHGKDATPGTGGYEIGIDWGELGASARLTVAGTSPFKGVLIYTNQGHFEKPLAADLHFKDCSLVGRELHQTVTHGSPATKASVEVSLHLPQGAAAAAGPVVVNVVILRSFQTWFWLNATVGDHPHAYL